MSKQRKDSYEALRDRLSAAIQEAYGGMDQQVNPFYLDSTYPDSIIVKNYDTGEYQEIPYTINLDGEVELGTPIVVDEIYQTVLNKMTLGDPLILLNTGKPAYRLLVQTDEELPAHDLGLDNIRYNPGAIREAVEGLEGYFVYDETQSNHNKRVNPESRGQKFAKVTNSGYCPQYGGYVDIEVFNEDYIPLLNEAHDNYQRGLPVREGPSTELRPLQVEEYGENSLEVTEFGYNGLAWVDNPRDTTLGVCGVLNNSLLTQMMEEDNLPKNTVELSKTEYDELVKSKSDLAELQTQYDEGKQLYLAGKKKYEDGLLAYNDLKKEEASLREQLIPVWTSQEDAKLEMVNSILETIPDSERESKKEIFTSMTPEQLGVIVNSLPTNTTPGGVLEGAGNPGEGGSFTLEKYEDICKKHGIKP